ncbi:MAG TPA: deoxyribose-phosphate aldolase [Gaiellaceae bacterium]
MAVERLESKRVTVESLTYAEIAKTIDHSLLRPELDLDTVAEGVRLAVRYDVASATVKPADVALAAGLVAGSDVLVSTVVGFPHGNSTPGTKAFEAERALDDGAHELDMVLNIARLRSGRDDEVRDEIRTIVELAVSRGAIVKVILENAYLTNEQKVLGCRLAEQAGAHFVKTSTGYAPTGATIEDLQLMRATVSPHIQVKAAGGVRTLDSLLDVLSVGVTRVGATATETMLEDFKARKAALDTDRDAS